MSRYSLGWGQERCVWEKEQHMQRPLSGMELAQYEGPIQALGTGAEKEGAWRKRRMERWEGLQSPHPHPHPRAQLFAETAGELLYLKGARGSPHSHHHLQLIAGMSSGRSGQGKGTPQEHVAMSQERRRLIFGARGCSLPTLLPGKAAGHRHPSLPARDPFPALRAH